MPNITVKTTEQTTTEQEITPDFCFTKAASVLLHGNNYGGGDPVSLAREWRELGETLAAQGPRPVERAAMSTDGEGRS